jgi:hypothetical protein
MAIIAILAVPALCQAQVIANNQTFNTISPCRLIDTRLSGQRFSPNQTQTFNIVGDLSSQGGNPNGCNLPPFSNSVPQVQALAINYVAVNPAGPGHLAVWPSDQPMPGTSAINFQLLNPNLNIANEVPTAVRQDVPGADFSVNSSQAVDVVADIVGYYSRFTGGPASGGWFSGKIALANPTAGALTAFGYANGLTPSTETCQICDPLTVSVLSPASPCTARDLAAKVLATSGSGGVRTITLLVNGQATGLTCTATDPAVICDSGSNSIAIPPASELAIHLAQDANGSALSGIEFGFVCN